MEGLNVTATGSASYGPGAAPVNGTGLAWWLTARRLAVPVLDAAVLAAGLAGHALVTLILLRNKRRVNGTGLLLLNLTAADLLQLACLPFTTASIAGARWTFGAFLCKLVSFIGTACSSASVFTLVALSINRCVTVAQSPSVRRPRRGCLFALVLLAVWVPALGLAVPQFIYRDLQLESMYCFAFLAELGVTVYSIALFLTGFAAPLLLVTAMYSKILCYIRRRSRTVVSAPASRLERCNAQVTKMTVALVLSFTLCWLPSYALMFLLVSDGGGGARWLQGPFPVFARLLASCSTVANPLIYAYFSKQFRSDLRRLACTPCRRISRGNRVKPMVQGAGITLQGGSQT